MSRRSTTFFVCTSVFISSLGYAKEDAFLLADLNHNGILEKSEFLNYVNGLRTALTPYLSLSEPLDDDTDFRPASSSLSSSTSMASIGDGVLSGIISIFGTEIGDKTFFIAAIMSMRHERGIVFAGAIGALIVMTVLSVALGGVVGYLLPPVYSHYAGTILFIFFGLQMLKSAKGLEGSAPSEELAEVEEDLMTKKKNEDNDDDAMETGTEPAEVPLITVLTQAFVLTFFAEWGDRSQIATITLSTTKSALGVTLGAVLGHCVCTGVAVLGGKLLASRISERSVAIFGGVLFLFFGAHSLVVGPPSTS